jgi:hypothetical protein
MNDQKQGQVQRPVFQAPGTSTDQALTPRTETATEVLAAQAREIVRARYLVAMQNPRDMDAVRQQLITDCGRFSFADPALYKRPIGGETKTGLSIRFVLAALRYMGNCDVSPQIIYENETKRIIKVTVTDLETNTNHSKDVSIEKTVERSKVRAGQQVLGSRVNSRGAQVYIVEATEDELNIKVDAQVSKAIRQLGTRLVSDELQDECLEIIRETIAKKIEADPDAEKKKIIDSFFDIGVSVEQLKRYLGVDDLSTVRDKKDLMDLRAVYQGIKAGETSWREVIEAREAARGDGEEKQPAAPTGRTAEILGKITKPQPQPQPAACEFCGTDPSKLKPGVACCLMKAQQAHEASPKPVPAAEPTYPTTQNFDPKTIPGVRAGVAAGPKSNTNQTKE